MFSSDQYCLSELMVDIVSAVLDGDYAAFLQMRNDGYRLTLVASEREQEGVELLVVGLDALDNVFLAFLGLTQIHNYPPKITDRALLCRNSEVSLC